MQSDNYLEWVCDSNYQSMIANLQFARHFFRVGFPFCSGDCLTVRMAQVHVPTYTYISDEPVVEGGMKQISIGSFTRGGFTKVTCAIAKLNRELIKVHGKIDTLQREAGLHKMARFLGVGWLSTNPAFEPSTPFWLVYVRDMCWRRFRFSCGWSSSDVWFDLFEFNAHARARF